MSVKDRVKIIAVADDFGMSKTANKNILELVKLGKVSRVSVLMQGATADALDQIDVKALLVSKVKIDIHLDSENFSNIKETERKLKEGLLGRSKKFFQAYFGKTGNEEVVYQQWEQQIEKFKLIFGKYPDGINSHQYIHFFPKYINLAIKLANKYQIPYVRFGKKSLLWSNSTAFLVLAFIRKISCYKADLANCNSSDYLISLDWIADVDSFIKTLPAGTVEIVCHPERQDEFELIKKSL